MPTRLPLSLQPELIHNPEHHMGQMSKKVTPVVVFVYFDRLFPPLNLWKAREATLT